MNRIMASARGVVQTLFSSRKKTLLLVLGCVVVANIMLVKAALKSLKLVPQKSVNSSYAIDKNVLLDADSGKVFTCGAGWGEMCYNYYDDERSIVDYCTRITSENLSFSFKKKKDRKPYEANCVGYAAYMTSLCNYLFERNHYKARAYHVRGTIKCLGVDVCKIAGKFSPFFKDYDFVLIKYGDGSEEIVDPSYEDFVTIM